MRTTKEEIKNHINFIEKYTDYKITKDYTEKTTTYNVTLHNELIAIIKSNNNSDVWDMLDPFWQKGFEIAKAQYSMEV